MRYETDSSQLKFVSDGQGHKMVQMERMVCVLFLNQGDESDDSVDECYAYHKRAAVPCKNQTVVITWL